MVAGVLGRRRGSVKIVVFLLKTVLLAGWEFAPRMIPARHTASRCFSQTAGSQIVEAEEESSDTYPQIRSSLEGSSDTYPLCI